MPGSAARLGRAAPHLAVEELLPFEQPPGVPWLEETLAKLRNSEWATQFEALTDLRRAARFAPRLLAGSLRQAVSLAVTLTDSPRAPVAQGALVLLQDLFLAFRKDMDAELGRCAPVCLRWAADSNCFLSEEAERTLVAMCRGASEERALSAVLLASEGADGPRFRAKCLACLLLLLQRFGPRLALNQDVERLLKSVAALLEDASGEIRRLARLAAVALHGAVGGPEFEQLVCRCLGWREAQLARQIFERPAERPACTPPDAVSLKRRPLASRGT